MDLFSPPWIPLVPCSNHYPSLLGFPCGSADKESPCNMGDLGLVPGLGRSPREGKGYPLQYSGLENSMDRVVHGVTKGQAQLNDFHSPISLNFKVFDHVSVYTEGASQVALVVKDLSANAGDIRDMDLISVLGRSPREGHGSSHKTFRIK